MKSDRGSITIWMLGLSVLLLLFGGLSIDFWRALALQRELAAGRDIVTEGRDQGTVAFPQAECKVYLTASPEERARRRLDQMRNRGENAALEEVLQRQNKRDEGDASRSVGPLMAADDAVEISTDGLTRQKVVLKLEALVRERQLTARQ